MGFDRGVLPPDRDQEETFPWMGVVAAVLIIGGLGALFYFFVFRGKTFVPDEEDVRSLLTLIGI